MNFGKLQRFWDRTERLRIVFEKHRTLLSLSATILSCGAAWAGYQARVNHQRKLEEQLSKITAEIQKEQLQLQQQQQQSNDLSVSPTSLVAMQQSNNNAVLKASLSDKRYVC